MNLKQIVTTLEQASEITGRPIKGQVNGYQHIVFETDRHHFKIQKRYVGPEDRGNPSSLIVCGDPKRWYSAGSSRKGAPRQIWIDNPTVRYLKTLAVQQAVEVK